MLFSVRSSFETDEKKDLFILFTEEVRRFSFLLYFLNMSEQCRKSLFRLNLIDGQRSEGGSSGTIRGTNEAGLNSLGAADSIDILFPSREKERGEIAGNLRNSRGCSPRLEIMSTQLCPAYAPFFGFAGVASAMIFSSEFDFDRWNLGLKWIGRWLTALKRRSDGGSVRYFQSRHRNLWNGNAPTRINYESKLLRSDRITPSLIVSATVVNPSGHGRNHRSLRIGRLSSHHRRHVTRCPVFPLRWLHTPRSWNVVRFHWSRRWTRHRNRR